ncbi:MAG: LysM domain-containing protein [Bacilli bacterium]|nr:LysM domain-containing protein [Bacilli bacterium]
MKQIISFKKDIPFNTRIGEITSISLEHTLKMIESDHIMGEFIVSGDYKITNVSINREPFSYNLPFDITLDTRYNVDQAKVDIDDFYYEIVNDQILNVNIDVLIDGIEVVNDFKIEKESEEVKDNPIDIKEIIEEIDEIEEEIDASDDLDEEEEDREVMDLFKEIETPAVDVAIEHDAVTEQKIKSLFDSFDDKNESFTTYHVHIVRENDTIETIVAKYNIPMEEIAAYNKIDELKLGDKIIVPTSLDEH